MQIEDLKRADWSIDKLKCYKMKAKGTESLANSILVHIYEPTVNDKEFAHINEYRLVLKLQQPFPFWKE